jgi:hypothetical protein
MNSFKTHSVFHFSKIYRRAGTLSPHARMVEWHGKNPM